MGAPAVALAERPPKPDRAEILRALDALFYPDAVIELRALHKTRKRTDAGYFDAAHREALADAAVRRNAAGAAVYVNLNPLDPQLLGRYANRVQEFAPATATDANVTRRRWLLLDLDPVRPKDTAATDAQLEAAFAVARELAAFLASEGWPAPIEAESGNGVHRLYPLDLPNDDESRDLVKGALTGLAQRFDTDAVKLDQSVFNAGRIVKMYGSVATKGDHTPAAPWRLSRLVAVPPRDGVVTPEQLRALHLKPAEAPRGRQSAKALNGRTFDLAEFLGRLGIEYTQDTHEGADRYRLEHCPFNRDHGRGEAAIFRRPDGRLGFRCQHNSCADKRWPDVLALVDGPRQTRPLRSGDSGDSGDSRANAGDAPSPVGGDALGTVGTPGFVVHGGWVWYTPPSKDGEDTPAAERVCSELHVRGQTRDADGSAWGRLLEFPDREGRLHRWACPMRMLAGDAQEFRAVLLDMGLVIEPSAKARQRLAVYVQTTRTGRTVTCTERTGWHGDAFVLPDSTLGTGDVLLQTLGEPPKLRQAGTLERWRDAVAGRCTGNSRLVFMVAAAFAPPLLAITGDESGGLHLVGPSSGGKTTALHAAASVWGGPDYLRRWRATTNGLEGIAQEHNDLPLVLDELAQVDAREAGEIAYMLANGTGKHRARRDGLAKPAARWRLLFLSDGEIGLAEHMREAGQRTRAGQEVRLAEVPADAGAGLGVFEQLHGYPGGGALADAILAATRTDHGMAGPAFLEKLLAADRAEVRAGIENLRADFNAEHVPAVANGQAARVAKRFALVAAAGELASAWGITGWETGAAIHAAGMCFRAWLERRGGAGPQEDDAALAQVRHFIELHGEARFSPMDGSNRTTINRAGFRRTINGAEQYLILPEVFRREVCAGFDYRRVAHLLLERGFLETEPPHLTLKPRGIKRVYCVREEVLA